MRIVLITGISGSGKSVALNALEDAGFYCVDNLPPRVLPELVREVAADGLSELAVAIDARSSGSLADMPDLIHSLSLEHELRVLFLNASTPALIQRFSETRRRHPLTGWSADANPLASLEEAIEHERELVAPLAEFGHQIDTSNLRANTLRSRVKQFIEQKHTDALILMFESFGFKRGIPLDADFVFDVRALPNPYYDHALRPLTGLDAPVADFLAAQPIVREMIADIEAFIGKWLPRFREDHRSYLTCAIGCTGGQHRSVYISETLARHFAGRNNVIVRHRDAPLSVEASSRLVTAA